MTDEIEAEKPVVIQLGCKDAPFVYFDGVPNLGLFNGVATLTLEALRNTLVDGVVVQDRAVVAYLRCSLPALRQLKEAIEGIELMATPIEQGAAN